MTAKKHSENAALRPSQAHFFAERTAQLKRIEDGLTLGADLTPKERTVARKILADVPDALVEGVAELASRSEARVAGVPFEPNDARATIAYAAASRAFVRALRRLARRVEDTVLERQRVVAVQTRAALRSLQALGMLPGNGDAATAAADLAQLKRRPRASKKPSSAPVAEAPKAA